MLLDAALALPLQPLVFHLVRVPLDHWLAAHLGSASTIYQWTKSLYTPLTEEPAKLLPLLIPTIRRDIRAENFVRYALAIGLGFAIGEMWFVAVALWRLRRRFEIGVVGAAGLHWLGNFPISLMAWNAGGLGKAFWTVAVQCWLLFYFFAAVALLARFAFGRLALGRLLFGSRHCPECHAEYDAPIFAVNLGSARYERCPQCRRWHWTRKPIKQ